MPVVPQLRVPGGLRVLIVDDHKIMREGLRELLHLEKDMKVVGEAENGQQALQLAHELHPDVVVMDVNLGDAMNGVEATRRIHAENPDIVVVGLSMHSDPDVAEDMRDAGAAAYLPKGGPSVDLVKAIRSCRL